MMIWDYFMRRKWLLIAVLAVFLISGTVSGFLLGNSDTYIVDSTVLNQPDELDNDQDAVAHVQVPILSEEAASENAATVESVASSTGESTDATETMADSAVETNAGLLAVNNSEAATIDTVITDETEAQQTDPRDIDVPLTGNAQAEVNEAWRTLFATWQQITWSIFGIIALALLAVVFARWSLWRKLR